MTKKSRIHQYKDRIDKIFDEMEAEGIVGSRVLFLIEHTKYGLACSESVSTNAADIYFFKNRIEEIIDEQKAGKKMQEMESQVKGFIDSLLGENKTVKEALKN